jgi:2-keto-4-pentenoate hydratase/2-oxohepta-3-ene-1,7-dioic acid hydratase in catechol pathway
MRLLTFIENGIEKVGAERNGGVIDLSRHLEGRGLRRIIEDGMVETARQIVETMSPDRRIERLRLAPPVTDPAKIICVGVNYMNRNEEYKDGSEAPNYPSLFMRTPLSFVAHGEAVEIPKESEQLDYEGEIVLVIGKPGRRIAQADAMSHVAGLTIMNEGSVRDWIRHGKFNVTQGKNFDRSGAIGPWVETDLSGIDVRNLGIETRVNGEVRQKDTTASMAFSFARIVEYVSTFTTLLPGDLIATGTPTGAGARFDPPKWLREGDVVEVDVEGVGTLRNTVVREA